MGAHVLGRVSIRETKRFSARLERVKRERSNMKSSVVRKSIPIIVSRLAVLSAGGGKHEERHGEEQGTSSATGLLCEPTQTTWEYVSQIRAIEPIELGGQVRGDLTGIFVDHGQLVKKGQKMSVPLPYQAELHKAGAEGGFADMEYQNTSVLASGRVVGSDASTLRLAS
jgi:membrane fusion protein (multidrug efflux system)